MNEIALSSSSNISQNGSYIIDGLSLDKSSICISINAYIKATILFVNLKDNVEINFDVEDNAIVKASIFQENDISILIKGNINESSSLQFYFADFTNGNISLATDLHLIKPNALCEWNLATLGMNQNQKEFDVSIYHDEKETKSLINNYGVAKDHSTVKFSGICQINKGCSLSSAHQNAKIMVFDEDCDAVAKPILKIDENSIEASHAAVVGKISDDYLYYLTSRGLSIEKSRELITFGYLKPIINGFDNDELKNRINDLIERGL